MIKFNPPLEWYEYKQDVVSGRRAKDDRPITEPALYYSTLTEQDKLGYDKQVRLFFADNLEMRNKSATYLRNLYYWEVKE